MTRELIELVAVLACTLFAGAAVYITAVEHPARLSCGTEIAAIEWAPSYKRATVMQVSLAVIAGLLGIVRGVQGADRSISCRLRLVDSQSPTPNSEDESMGNRKLGVSE